MVNNEKLVYKLLENVPEDSYFAAFSLRRKKDGFSKNSWRDVFIFSNEEEFKEEQAYMMESLSRGERVMLSVNPINNSIVEEIMIYDLLGSRLGSDKDPMSNKKLRNLYISALMRAASSKVKRVIVDVDSNDYNEVDKIVIGLQRLENGPTDPDRTYIVHSPNGYHIICNPFNKKEAVDKGIITPDMYYRHRCQLTNLYA
jgi:hypothetical protein